MCFKIIVNDERGIPPIPRDLEPREFFEHVKVQSEGEVNGWS